MRRCHDSECRHDVIYDGHVRLRLETQWNEDMIGIGEVGMLPGAILPWSNSVESTLRSFH